MTALPYLTAPALEPRLRWTAMADALLEGHRAARADVGDLFLKKRADTLLTRAAWIEGLGIGLKSVTVYPENPGRTPPAPAIQGVFILFDEASGAPRALIDGALITKWKTAADSILGARLLARPEARTLLIVGAGAVARALAEAYRAQFPGLERIAIWNRTPEKAAALAAELGLAVATDLAVAASAADIVSCATMSTQPLLRGDWIAPGTHVDLIGAFRPDMREADDDLLLKSELFVDSRETTFHDIGELRIPLEAGVIAPEHVRGDLYDLAAGAARRSAPDAITVYKNGGGAHLDLMIALAMVRAAGL